MEARASARLASAAARCAGCLDAGRVDNASRAAPERPSGALLCAPARVAQLTSAPHPLRHRTLRAREPSARLAVPPRCYGADSDAAGRLCAHRLHAARGADRAASLFGLGRAADPAGAVLDRLEPHGTRKAAPRPRKSPRPAGLFVLLHRLCSDVRGRGISLHPDRRISRDGAVYPLVLSLHAPSAR